jgi:hypothetical protein
MEGMKPPMMNVPPGMLPPRPVPTENPSINGPRHIPNPFFPFGLGSIFPYNLIPHGIHGVFREKQNVEEIFPHESIRARDVGAAVAQSKMNQRRPPKEIQNDGANTHVRHAGAIRFGVEISMRIFSRAGRRIPVVGKIPLDRFKRALVSVMGALKPTTRVIAAARSATRIDMPKISDLRNGENQCLRGVHIIDLAVSLETAIHSPWELEEIQRQQSFAEGNFHAKRRSIVTKPSNALCGAMPPLPGGHA